MSNKGSPFERDMARAFSMWWTNGERDDVFWRVMASGGRATVRMKNKGSRTEGQHGDLCATAPCAMPFTRMFTVEFKRGYKDWSLMDAFDRPPKSKPSTFEKFIEQARRQRDEAGTKYFMLITRKDRRDAVVFTDYFHGQAIIPLEYPFGKFVIDGGAPIRVLPLKAFFMLVTPQSIIDNVRLVRLGLDHA